MEIQIVARNSDVPEAVRSYAHRKINKLSRYLPTVTRAQVELTLENTRSAAHRAVVQVTLTSKGGLLRAQDRSPDFRASIDAVAQALERQVKRYKARLYRSEQPRTKATAALAEASAPRVTEEESRAVVRRKRFPMKPMTPEEAIDEMELLGHTFFLFLNAETQQYNVVYQRSGGDYGLIEPEPL